MARETYKPRSRKCQAAGATVSLLILSLLSFTDFTLAADPPARATGPTTRPITIARSSPPPAPVTQPAPVPTATMAHWFADLANPDGNRRNQAFEYMMGLRSEDLPALRKLVEITRPLAPEQAMALRQIVTQVFLAGDPYDVDGSAGFLGIHLPPAGLGMYDEGVVVVDRIAGFVGARMLRNGDIVLGIVQRPTLALRTSSDLISALLDSPAGTRIDFQILRQGQVIFVAVKLDPRPLLGRFNDLGSMDALDRERRDRADEYWDKHFAELIDDAII